MMKGDSPISGEVKSVNAVDGGADPSGSLKMSFGETVRVDPAACKGSLIVVNAEVEKSKDMSPAKAGPRPAPMFESNELLLCRSAMFTLYCGILVLELENNGTGGRCWCCN